MLACAHSCSCSSPVGSRRLLPNRQAVGPCTGYARLVRLQARKPTASFDSSDELDRDLADELTAVADPMRGERMKKHFELLWKVQNSRGSVEVCSCCTGSGEKECDWCHGTGVMTVGDSVYLNINRSQCPVCKAKGYVKCESCRGTGSRAKWLGPSSGPSTMADK